MSKGEGQLTLSHTGTKMRLQAHLEIILKSCNSRKLLHNFPLYSAVQLKFKAPQRHRALKHMQIA